MKVELQPCIEHVGIDKKYQWNFTVYTKSTKVKSVWYIALPITSAHRGSHSGGGNKWRGIDGQEKYKNEGCVYPHASLLEMITYHNMHFPCIKWKYIDASHYNWEMLKEIIQDNPPDVAAFTVYTASYLWALIVSAYLKKLNPNVVTIFGNDHASLLKKEILQGDYGSKIVDFIGDGNNGPFTMMGLLSYLEGSLPLTKIPSIAYRTQSGEVVIQAANTYPTNQRMLPDYRLIEGYLKEHYDPAFQLWYADHFEMKRMVTFPLASGCNWGKHPKRRCLHCSIQGLTPKTAKISSIIERFEQIVGELKSNVYSAGDSTMGFTSNQWDCNPFLDHLARACADSKVLRNRRFLKMYGLVKEFLDSAQVHKNFCHTWNVGVEAFDPEILKNDSKGINSGTEELYQAMELAKDFGYKVTPSGIVGLPGTSLKSLKQEVYNWLAFIEAYKELIPLVMIALPGVIPGSRMYYSLFSKNKIVQKLHGESIPCRMLSKIYIESTTDVTIEDVEAAQQDIAKGIIMISQKYNTSIKVGANSMGGSDEHEKREIAILKQLIS